MSTPSGWHTDPLNPNYFRFWDGNQWTNNVSPKHAPVPAPAPIIQRPATIIQPSFVQPDFSQNLNIEKPVYFPPQELKFSNPAPNKPIVAPEYSYSPKEIEFKPPEASIQKIATLVKPKKKTRKVWTAFWIVLFLLIVGNMKENPGLGVFLILLGIAIFLTLVIRKLINAVKPLLKTKEEKPESISNISMKDSFVAKSDLKPFKSLGKLFNNDEIKSSQEKFSPPDILDIYSGIVPEISNNKRGVQL